MTYRLEQVAGLTVGSWGDDAGIPVLAIHGITANHLAWKAVAESYGGAVIAPDLRGRGGSWELPGPSGLANHAADLVTVLDALGVEKAIVVGHSMGGFVANVFAHRYPARVERLVLVDGGVPFPAFEGDVDEVMDAILGPALARLQLTWPDLDAVHQFWRAHPALSEWNSAVEAYVDYDVGPVPGGLRSRIAPELIRADGRDMHVGTAAKDAYAAKIPAVFLHAERGLLDEPTPLYPNPEEFADHLTVERLPGSNHYTILFAPRYADALDQVLQNGAA